MSLSNALLRTPWPLILLTGALGSGKTTLLRHILTHAEFKGMAVLVNELGEIGLDHHLIERIDDQIVLMGSGCLCCSLRGDLPQTLRMLERRWLAGTLPEVSGVIVETTGMADPGPILATLAANPLVNNAFRLRLVVTTIDAVNGLGQLRAWPELRRQAASADVLMLTKADLTDGPPLDLIAHLASLNPLASLHLARHGVVDDTSEFLKSLRHSLDPDALARSMRALPLCEALEEGQASHRQIGALSFVARQPVDWHPLQRLLAELVAGHAEHLLRLKAILDIEGRPHPIMLHGVHETFYPPEELEAWPDGERGSRLVIILDDFERQARPVMELMGRDTGWQGPKMSSDVISHR
jgi:G3E family GTPase